MQEIAVIQCLQTQVTELQITLRQQRSRQLGEIKLRQLVVQQLSLDATLDEAREVVDVRLFGVCLRYLATKYFFAYRVH